MKQFFVISILIVSMAAMSYGGETVKSKKGKYHYRGMNASYNTLALVLNIVQDTMPDGEYKSEFIKTLNDPVYLGEKDFEWIERSMKKRLQLKKY